MLQVLSERYARVRHYKFLKDGKPVFEYHRNSIDYVNRTLSKIPDRIDHNNHDLVLLTLRVLSGFSRGLLTSGAFFLLHKLSLICPEIERVGARGHA